jgi:uncharacterized membrane protein
MKGRHPIIRFFAHLVSNPWQVRRRFSKSAMRHIEQAITASERSHSGEIRFVVEAGLHPYEIMFRKTPRKRAIELFGRLNIWDTEHNNGVLIYLLLADKDVEIVADRGIDRCVGYENWESICQDMENLFRKGEYEAAVLQGIAEISMHLQRNFPYQESNNNEIPNQPLVL